MLTSTKGELDMAAKRVLIVLGKLKRGGAETLVMNIYRTIDRSVVQFDFIVHTPDRYDYDDEIESLGGKIYRFPQYNVINRSCNNSAQPHSSVSKGYKAEGDRPLSPSAEESGGLPVCLFK